MKKISLSVHAAAYISLGLLCGWYHFLFVSFCAIGIVLAFDANFYLKVASIAVVLIGLIFSNTPLSYQPWENFMNSWIFNVWKDYFDMTADSSSIILKKDEKYMFFEFPHGVFPVGQVVSASFIRSCFPGHMICGVAADVVFKAPGMRQFMSWIGTRPADRQNISKILNEGYSCAVIPGGIAEIYLVNDKTEELYLRVRRKTVKAAIEEGAHIVPTFFFGNSKLFTVVGSGVDSWLAKLSRALRVSLVFFYGRNYLPVPFRHPIHMATGDLVQVVKKSNPTEEDIDDVMNRLVVSVEKLYETKKPEWEKRPLVIK